MRTCIQRNLPFLFLALIATPLLWFPIVDIDIWWHLKTGEIIWAQHQFPRTDLFSYTASGHPWINHEWLFQVIYYLLFHHLGQGGIIALRLVVGFATLLGMYQAGVWFSQKRLLPLLISGLAFQFVALRFTDRAAMYTTLGISLTLMILAGVQNGALSRRAHLLLFPLFLVWTNVHGGMILGLAILFCVWLPEIIRRWRKGERPCPWWEREELIFVLLVVIVLINPWGYRILTFPFENWGLSFTRTHTGEWLSALHPAASSLTLEGKRIPYLFAGIGALLIFSVRRLPLPYFLVLALGTALTLSAVRFVADLACMAAPIVAWRFAPRVEQWRIARWLVVLGIVLLPVATLHQAYNRGGLKEQEDRILASALPHYAPDLMEFLNKLEIRGKVFNDLNLGPSFIYLRWPQEKVFIDTRQGVYGDEFNRNYLLAAQDPLAFEALSTRYGGFDYVLLEYWIHAPSVKLNAYLWKHPDWSLVYYSSKGFIYLKNVPKFYPIIQRMGFKEPPTALQEMIPGLKPKEGLH